MSQIKGTANGSLAAIGMVEWDRGTREITGQGIPHLRFSYGVEMQDVSGAMFKRIIVPVIPHPLKLNANVIYAALLRGLEQIVFVGDEAVIKVAIEKKKIESPLGLSL